MKIFDLIKFNTIYENILDIEKYGCIQIGNEHSIYFEEFHREYHYRLTFTSHIKRNECTRILEQLLPGLRGMDKIC